MAYEKLILGALAGDIIGSVFEKNNIKDLDFNLFCDQSRFTDDSVMTVATMQTLIDEEKDYVISYQKFGRSYPKAGYGPQFREWIKSNDPKPYNSWGNGSAMRVSPIGWYCQDIDEVMIEAKKSAEISHDHIEGIKGAQAVATAVFLARIGRNKLEIKNYIKDKFGYDLNRKICVIRQNYKFDSSCQGSVPEAIIAFLESKDFEDAIRLAISIGGDSDTIACITGSIAEAFYGAVPIEIIENVLKLIPNEMINVIYTFSELCINKKTKIHQIPFIQDILSAFEINHIALAIDIFFRNVISTGDDTGKELFYKYINNSEEFEHCIQFLLYPKEKVLLYLDNDEVNHKRLVNVEITYEHAKKQIERLLLSIKSKKVVVNLLHLLSQVQNVSIKRVGLQCMSASYDEIFMFDELRNKANEALSKMETADFNVEHYADMIKDSYNG
jgi:ADP-ribosylglycohydrolase